MHRTWSTVLAGAAALLGLAPASASAGSFAEEARADGTVVEASFNNPAPGAVDTTITDHLRGLVERAPAHATIKVALHSISGTGMKNALVAEAPGRDGAGSVTVIYDGTKMGTVSTQLRDELRAAGGRFVQCDRRTDSTDAGACLGTKSTSRQHAKYALISETTKATGAAGLGAQRHVVWIGSANVTGDSGWEAYNDAATTYGDADLYAGLERIFDTAAAQTWGSADFYDNPAGNGYVHGASANVSAFASPENTAGRDLVLERLDQITPTAECRVRVMQSLFQGDRGQAIARKLVELRDRGCGVWVLVDAKDTGEPSVGTDVKPILCGGAIPLRSRPNIHDKALLIRGIYAGSTMKDIAFTGSHNITDPALRENDEILARVGHGNGVIYDAFWQHFTTPFNAGTPVC